MSSCITHLEGFASMTSSFTSSKLSSPVMKPSTPTSLEALEAPSGFTPEMILALFERTDNVSRREGIVAEREVFLSYQVAAVVRRERKIDRRENELGVKRLPALDKLQMALEQLQATEVIAAMKILHTFQIKVLSDVHLPMPKNKASSTTGEIDAQAMDIDRGHPSEAADSVMNKKSETTGEDMPSTVEIEQGEVMSFPKDKFSAESAKGAGRVHENDPQNGQQSGSLVSPEEMTPATTNVDSTRDSPATVDNQNGATEQKMKDAADKEDDVVCKPVNNPLPPYQDQSAKIIDEAVRKERERKSRLNNIDWPVVNEGRISQSSVTPPSNPKSIFATVPFRTPNAVNDAYNSPFHPDHRQSDCFRTFTPPNFTTGEIPPPPKRTWPVDEVLRGPTRPTHPSARVNSLRFSTGLEPQCFWQTNYETPQPKPELSFDQTRHGDLFSSPIPSADGHTSHPFDSELPPIFD